MTPTGTSSEANCLSEVGATLKQIIPGEGLAARYGGDEFVIALPGAGRQETYWVAETVRQNIADRAFVVSADPENSDGVPNIHIEGLVTCSIGIATLQSDIMPELSAENRRFQKCQRPAPSQG